MNVTETGSEGLKHEFQVIVSAEEIDTIMQRRLMEVGKKVKIPGFRPGKVPVKILKQRYGQSVMGEVLEQAVNEGSSKAIQENELRPAMQPKIDVKDFGEDKGLTFTMEVEVLPEIGEVDVKSIALDRLVAEPGDVEIDEALERIAAGNKVNETVKTKRAAKSGDIVLIDFDGSVDGEKRPGMKAEGFELELGSGQFIPGFEEQLEGKKPGDDVTVTVTFPENYGEKTLAGKEAVFECKLHEIRQAVPAEVNEDLAKSLGLESMEKLRAAVKEKLEEEYTRISRDRLKRALLDKLAEAHDFQVPAGMVDMEFDAIWKRLEQEKEQGNLPEEDAAKSEDDLKAEYRAIAERRVRLGLLLSEIGRANNIEITGEELRGAVMQEARRYPGQEREVIEFYQQNPRAIENLRAPLYEDKVVTFITEMGTVSDRNVSVAELTADPDEDAAPAKKAPAKKKAAPKKAAPKKAATKNAEAGADEEKPAKKTAAKKKAPAKKKAE